MIWHKASPGNWTPNRYQQDSEFMFVLSAGAPKAANMIKDRVTTTGGESRNRQWQKGRMANGDIEVKHKKVVYERHALRSSVWYIVLAPAHEANRHAQTFKHPATFPYALARDHIRTWPNEGDVVLDPMAGSGTTLLAAKRLGRRAIGIEIEERYCEIAARRLSQEVMAL